MQLCRALHPRQRRPADLGWGRSLMGLVGGSATHPAEAWCLLGGLDTRQLPRASLLHSPIEFIFFYFLFFIIFYFIYLFFIYGCVGSSFLCEGFL